MSQNDTNQLMPSEYYNKETTNRSAYEDRAESLAKLTIPALMRDKSWNGSATTPDDYAQSYGARLVNNLKSRLGTTLFPPNSSAFRFTPSEELLADAENSSKLEELQRAIINTQNKVTTRLEALNTRNTIFNILEHLIVVSSVVLERVKGEGYKVHTLRNFVVSLDDKGNEFKICVKERLRKEQLPDGFTPKGTEQDKEFYDLYTQLEATEKDKWVMVQEIDGELVGKEQTFTDKTRPFAYQGWIWSQGDFYHRPYCDDYEGDLKAVNTFAKVLTKGALISSKSITMVDERGGRTRIRDLRLAENGAIIQGRADDVTSFQHGKNYDFQVAQNAMAELKQELAITFLMTEGLRRNAERVTAEEIRMITNEAQNSLASVYSMVSNRLIKRMVWWAMDDLNISDSDIDIDIVTGIDALGRQAEAQKLDEFLSRGGSLGYLDRVDMGKVAQRYSSFYNVDVSDGLLMSDEQYQKKVEQVQQQQQQQMANEAVMKGAEAQMAK